ncbi:MAG: tRNA (adenosine(37)-N6)-dimethylallyltransferase MiaA [Leptospirales bacterium]
MKNTNKVEPKSPVILITGATASGKSKSIYSLDSSSPIEVVNADSRQIYSQLKIGTALPSDEELARFKHHLFSFIQPTETFSAGRYLKESQKVIQDIIERGKIPVIVGGTFFYIKALWDGLPQIPEIDKSITDDVESMNPEEVLDKLKTVDPESFQRISSNDLYRLRRALSVSLSTGKPLSSYKPVGGIFNEYNFKSFWLDYPREILYERINERTQLMFGQGLIDEIRELISRGYNENTPALTSIGYKEIFDILKETGTAIQDWNVELDKKAIEKISQYTRNFAKRQITWFRGEKRLKRIDQTCLVFQISDILTEIASVKTKK